MASETSMLLSMRPCYARKIFSGVKTVELRRVRPQVHAGDRVYVYVTSPVKALAGWFTIKDVLHVAPSTLWRRVGPQSGVTKREFDAYYAGASTAVGLIVGEVLEYNEWIGLASLRALVPRFHPPRSFQYVCSNLFDHSLASMA